MKTNGKPGKASRPFVPSGAPAAKGKAASDSRPRPKRASRPMYQVDHPDYSELEGLGESPAEESQGPAAEGARPGGIRMVKLHGFAAAAIPTDERLVGEQGLGAGKAEDEPEFLASSGDGAASEWARLKEIRFSPALKIRTSPTVRLLPQEAPSQETPDSGAGAPSAKEEADGASAAELLSVELDAERAGTQASGRLAEPAADGSELQFGTVSFDFKERSRLDLILPLKQPFRDTGYSIACSLDVPFCHAVVRAKLGAEAVVTLIRTQEEGNSRGRLDWIAAGRKG